MIKKIYLFAISLILVSCTNQVSTTYDVIVLGVNRTLFNLHDRYTIGINGVGSVKMQLPANLNSDPEWSPNGEWIISSSQYEVGRPEDSAIYLIRSDGSQRRLIVHNRGGSFDPTWSFDGTRIAYYARDNQTGIYILDMQCFEFPEGKCNSLPIYLTSGDSSPDWSPDGKQIAYQNKENIFVINSNGNQQPLNLTPNMSYCHDPKWSPEGTRLLFSCYQPDHFDIFVIKADGSDLINLTKGIGSNTQPQWSPDGSKIAFISTRDGLGQIIGMEDTIRSNAVFLMDSDGTNVTRLSLRDDEDVLWFAWFIK